MKRHTPRELIASVAQCALAGLLLLCPILYAVFLYVLLFEFVLAGRSYPPWMGDGFMVIAVLAGYAVVPTLIRGWYKRLKNQIEAWGKHRGR